jgi:hypothetical protein
VLVLVYVSLAVFVREFGLKVPLGIEWGEELDLEAMLWGLTELDMDKMSMQLTAAAQAGGEST